MQHSRHRVAFDRSVSADEGALQAEHASWSGKALMLNGPDPACDRIALCRVWQRLRAGGLQMQQSRRTGRPSTVVSAQMRAPCKPSTRAPWPPGRRFSQKLL